MRAPLDDEIRLTDLRRRTSQKWTRYPQDVLPLFVAESDFPAPPNVARALREAIDNGDFGYAEPHGLGEAFAGFARERFGSAPEPEDVFAVPEVMVGVAEILRAIADESDRVVINPPVYPPFFHTLEEVGVHTETVELCRDGEKYGLAFDALERAFANGVRAYLFCNPHNPVGRVFEERDLRRIAELAREYDVVVIADEIHAPLVLPGAAHVPFDRIARETGVRGFTMTSASKGWNIAGLKCALAIASGDWSREVLRSLPEDMPERAGNLGVIATKAAFSHDVPYLDRVVSHLDVMRRFLRETLDANGLSAIGYAPPQAGYLAWLDCRELHLDAEPARVFYKRGNVALNPGTKFGQPGHGFVRLNFGTSSEIVEEAVRRMASAIA